MLLHRKRMARRLRRNRCFDAVLHALQRRRDHQVLVRRDRREVLPRVFGRERGIHLPLFDLHGLLVFEVQQARMKHGTAYRELHFIGEHFIDDRRAQMQHVSAIRVTARDDFIGDTANLDERRRIFRLRDERARALHARQDLLCRQFAQRAVHRHARDLELARQFVFGGHLVAFLPLARVNARQDVVLDLLIGRRVHAGCSDSNENETVLRDVTVLHLRRDGRDVRCEIVIEIVVRDSARSVFITSAQRGLV